MQEFALFAEFHISLQQTRRDTEMKFATILKFGAKNGMQSVDHLLKSALHRLPSIQRTSGQIAVFDNLFKQSDLLTLQRSSDFPC